MYKQPCYVRHKNTFLNVILSSLPGEWESSLMWLLFLHNKGKNYQFLRVSNELWLELDELMLMNINLCWLCVQKGILKCISFICTDNFYSSGETLSSVTRFEIHLKPMTSTHRASCSTALVTPFIFWKQKNIVNDNGIGISWLSLSKLSCVFRLLIARL